MILIEFPNDVYVIPSTIESFCLRNPTDDYYLVDINCSRLTYQTKFDKKEDALKCIERLKDYFRNLKE